MHLLVGSSKPCCGNYCISEFKAQVKRCRNCSYCPSHLVFLSSRSASLHRKGGRVTGCSFAWRHKEQLRTLLDYIGSAYSYFEKGCQKNCARYNPERCFGIWSIHCSWHCSCRTYFCCFPLAFANTRSWPLVPFFESSFEKQWTKNHPQYLSGLSRALFPTTFLEIAVFPPMMRHVRHPLLNFLLPYCRLCNVLNATCVLVGRYLLDLLEYAHTFLFRPTQSIGLKICVRLFSLRLRTLVLRLHCSSSVWHPQSTLFACMMWGF